MSNPFSDVSYDELLTLHREEKKKNDEQIRELIAILNRVLNGNFCFLLKMTIENPDSIDTLKASLEDENAFRITKYFTKTFIEDVRNTILTEIKSVKIQLDTDQEMLDYARNKAETQPGTLERRVFCNKEESIDFIYNQISELIFLKFVKSEKRTRFFELEAWSTC